MLLAVTAVSGHGVGAQGADPAAQRFARAWENGTPASVTGQLSVFQTDDAQGNSGVTQLWKRSTNHSPVRSSRIDQMAKIPETCLSVLTGVTSEVDCCP
jgi:hypothetical protein